MLNNFIGISTLIVLITTLISFELQAASNNCRPEIDGYSCCNWVRHAHQKCHTNTCKDATISIWKRSDDDCVFGKTSLDNLMIDIDAINDLEIQKTYNERLLLHVKFFGIRDDRDFETLNKNININAQSQEALNNITTCQQNCEGTFSNAVNSPRMKVMKRFSGGGYYGREVERITEIKNQCNDNCIYKYGESSSDNIYSEYHVSHILLKTQEEAETVISRLKNNEIFSNLAKELSSNNDGDLGWLHINSIIKPLADILKTLDIGDYSNTPIETQTGWLVVFLHDVR